jgi:hypothetical protein
MLKRAVEHFHFPYGRAEQEGSEGNKEERGMVGECNGETWK